MRSRAGQLVRILGAIGAPLLWSNVVLPRLRLGIRGRTAANAGAATGYALAFGGRPNWWSRRGWGYGAAAAGIVAVGYGTAVALPPVRRALRQQADRAPEVSTIEWVGIHIPVGTVYTEELIFRATLTPLLSRTCAGGEILGAAVFGLWHITPARAAGDSLPGTIMATTMAGAVFDWLRRTSGSTTTPALAHGALNAGGALSASPRFIARLKREAACPGDRRFRRQKA